MKKWEPTILVKIGDRLHTEVMPWEGFWWTRDGWDRKIPLTKVRDREAGFIGDMLNPYRITGRIERSVKIKEPEIHLLREKVLRLEEEVAVLRAALDEATQGREENVGGWIEL